MRSSAIKEGQKSSGAITHAGGADKKDGGNGEPEGAESVPAEKQMNKSEGVEKPMSSGTEKQASRGTAYKSASGDEEKSGATDEATTVVLFQSRFEQPGRHGLKKKHTQKKRPCRNGDQ